jgi:hypothetical protein
MPSSMQQRCSACLVPATALSCAAAGGLLFVPALKAVATPWQTRTSAAPTTAASASPLPRIAAAAIGAIGAAGAFSALTAATLAGGKPRRQAAGRTTMAAFDPATMPGSTDPLGFFDPLGFTKGKDEANFQKLRVSETKHGRVAMMASIGTVVSHYVKLPGFEKVPAGLGAVTNEAALPALLGLVVVSGVLELALWRDDTSTEPGNFGDPLRLGSAVYVERTYELNNGRMAMMAVLGQVVAELVSGKDAVQQLGLQ